MDTVAELLDARRNHECTFECLKAFNQTLKAGGGYIDICTDSSCRLVGAPVLTIADDGNGMHVKTPPKEWQTAYENIQALLMHCKEYHSYTHVVGRRDGPI